MKPPSPLSDATSRSLIKVRNGLSVSLTSIEFFQRKVMDKIAA